MVVTDRVSQSCVALDQSSHHVHSLVGRVVEYLDVQFLAGVLHAADTVDEPVSHVLLVEHWQLHGDRGQVLELGRRCPGTVPALPVVQVDEDVAVHTVGGQQDQDHKVGDEQGKIEGVYLIQALKGLVQEVLAQVLADASRLR